MDNILFASLQKTLQRKAFNNNERQINAKGDEMNKRAGVSTAQITIPLAELRATLSNSASTKVVDFITTEKTQILDKTTFIDGLESNALFPIINANCSRWSGEDATSGETANITLTPHRLYSEITFSLQSAKSTNEKLQNAVTEEIINNIYNKVESTIFSGADSTQGEPKGLFNVLSSHTISSGCTIEELTEIEKKYYQSQSTNAPTYLFSPSAFETIKTEHANLFNNGKFNDIEYIISNNVEDGSFLLCDLSALVVGEFGSLNVDVDDKTQKFKGNVRLFINVFYDWNVTNPNAFIYGKFETES